MKKNISWSVFHHTFQPDKDPAAGNLTLNGISYPIGGFGVDGITISPKSRNFKRLYYAPLASFKGFSILTKVLKNSYSPEAAKGNITLKDSDIHNDGTFISQADGILMDSTGRIFYGMQMENALAYWQPDKTLKLKTEVRFLQNKNDIQWIDGLTFDNKGNILFTSNNLPKIIPDSYDITKVNMKIVRSKVGAKSYMYL